MEFCQAQQQVLGDVPGVDAHLDSSAELSYQSLLLSKFCSERRNWRGTQSGLSKELFLGPFPHLLWEPMGPRTLT